MTGFSETGDIAQGRVNLIAMMNPYLAHYWLAALACHGATTPENLGGGCKPKLHEAPQREEDKNVLGEWGGEGDGHGDGHVTYFEQFCVLSSGLSTYGPCAVVQWSDSSRL